MPTSISEYTEVHSTQVAIADFVAWLRAVRHQDIDRYIYDGENAYTDNRGDYELSESEFYERKNNLDGLPNFEPIDRGQVIKLIGDSCGQDVGKIRVAMVTLKQMGYALDGRIVSDAVRKRSQEGVAAIVRWSRGQTDEIE